MLMNRKKLATYALVMAAIFFVIILVYPMMFNSNRVAAPEAPQPAVVPNQPVVAPGAPVVGH